MQLAQQVPRALTPLFLVPRETRETSVRQAQLVRQARLVLHQQCLDLLARRGRLV